MEIQRLVWKQNGIEAKAHIRYVNNRFDLITKIVNIW